MKPKKATDPERELHSLIIEGDDLALSKLYELHGDSVIRSLKLWYKSIKDEALIFQAVNEAFLGYYKNPKTYNPELNTLQRFLEIAADRDLKNILQKEKKLKNNENIVEGVELVPKSRNSIIKDENETDDQLILDQSMSEVNKELSKYFKTDSDVSMAKLILSSERSTKVFAKTLKIEHLSFEEQKVLVKKNKDRIKKVLERNQVEARVKALLNE